MGRCRKRIIGSLIIFTFIFSFSLQAFCEDLPEDLEDIDNIEMSEDIKISNDVISGQIIDVKKDLSDLTSDVQENIEITRELYSMQKSEEENTEELEVIDYTEKFEDLHKDNQKIMISLWCLFGMLLGSKLIKGMFGNG